MMPIVVGPPGLFGKAPTHGDFLHVNTGARAFMAFDDWLTGAVEWAAARAGAAWPDAFTKGAIHAFVFRLPAEPTTLLTGAFGPSADRAGRKFPLVVAAPLTLDERRPPTPALLPLLLEPFWDTAGRLIVELGMRPELDARDALAGIPVEAPPDPEEVSASYEEWTHTLPLEELWELTGLSDGAAAARTLQVLAEALRPLCAKERSDSPLSLRLPLGAAGGAALCFWLDLSGRLLRWQKSVPSFFWSHDGESGALMLQPGMPPPSTLSELFLPTGARDEICDLTAPPAEAAVAAIPPLDERVAAVLAQGGARVTDLLEAVG